MLTNYLFLRLSRSRLSSSSYLSCSFTRSLRFALRSSLPKKMLITPTTNKTGISHTSISPNPLMIALVKGVKSGVAMIFAPIFSALHAPVAGVCLVAFAGDFGGRK